jgi:NAD(P)-dependent dehydrogenase (short-subunit alcohol dehydrogenase family)
MGSIQSPLQPQPSPSTTLPSTTTSSTPLSILITGGASGIGLALCTHFALSPVPIHITVLDINPSLFPTLTSSIPLSNPKSTLTFLQCDVSSWSSQAAAFKSTYARVGRIDIVFANAGISKDAVLIPPSNSLESSLDEPQEPNLANVGVNLNGAIYTVKLGIHYLLRNTPTLINGVPSRGELICTASNAGIYAFPIAPVYSATKAGVIALVRSLAVPLKAYDIQINALAPAVLETNIAPDKALFERMILTPMSTLTRGVEGWVGNRRRTGEVCEVHGEGFTVRAVCDFVDEDSRRNLEEFSRLGYA